MRAPFRALLQLFPTLLLPQKHFHERQHCLQRTLLLLGHCAMCSVFYGAQRACSGPGWISKPEWASSQATPELRPKKRGSRPEPVEQCRWRSRSSRGSSNSRSSNSNREAGITMSVLQKH
ncbi:uncharacterized protein ASCRUDRAFT_77280 [Ascoidea rubescens DSM 1968]|uniref:Uncharacterized protein n=1 Tax=Ascoidea rubescens DSM 1968 TaxID=1344418 RepID=A0A1D2VC31_9ASCO|nr:hypothetical protein ASCRUDRAFT_77280 [Ascoidea rubescens DSM 1968]ODV59196.1 hypothetical protein ASCRUDRAFT_77280 [Ascoidea rubescens DSM 1968]